MMVIEAVAPPANSCNNSDEDTDKPPLALALAPLVVLAVPTPAALVPAAAVVVALAVTVAPIVPPPLAGAGPGF